MAPMLDDPQIEAIRTLLRLAERYRVAELEVEQNGLRIIIRGWAREHGQARALSHGLPEPLPETAASLLDDEPDRRTVVEDLHDLVSPMTGTFYRAPLPELPPYVEEGQLVEEGQPVGVIEAMKVFSDVPADRSGRVLEFRAQNGELVQQGDPILVIEAAG
jgi:acetyl-CoA carboxylase biotin carboxyl carrier protein